MNDEMKNYIWPLAIVGIVAVVAIFGLVMIGGSNNIRSSGVAQLSEENTAGQGSRRPIYKCSDSDGGLKFSVKGRIKITRPKITRPDVGIAYDKCVNSDLLKERYCGDTPIKSSKKYTCPNGCENGACVGPSEPMEHTLKLNETKKYKTPGDSAELTLVSTSRNEATFRFKSK